MTNRIRTTATALLAALTIAAAGATTATAIPYNPDGNGGYENPTGGAPSAANTYNCTHWSGGECVQRRCTAGGGNNCQTFSQSCTTQGYTYNGNSQTGTCSRQNLA